MFIYLQLYFESDNYFFKFERRSPQYIRPGKNFFTVVYLEEVKVAGAFLADERASLQKIREPICADSSHKSDIGESAER